MIVTESPFRERVRAITPRLEFVVTRQFVLPDRSARCPRMLTGPCPRPADISGNRRTRRLDHVRSSGCFKAPWSTRWRHVAHRAKLVATIAGVVGCALSLAACDSAFRLRGELMVDPRGEPSCELRLHNASDGAVLRRRSVRGTFLELFTVSVVPRDYYVTIICNGAADQFKSETFRLGFRRHYDPPLELGKIVLSRRETPAPKP